MKRRVVSCLPAHAHTVGPNELGHQLDAAALVTRRSLMFLELTSTSSTSIIAQLLPLLRRCHTAFGVCQGFHLSSKSRGVKHVRSRNGEGKPRRCSGGGALQEAQWQELWAQRMQLELGGKGLLGVVTGKEEDKGGKDEQALILIGKHCDDCHPDVAMTAGGGRAAWAALAAMHRETSLQRVTDLRRQLNDLKKEEDEPIIMYMGRARQLIGELALISGHKFENNNEELITAVLLGLPDEYETLVTVLHGVAQTTRMSVEDVLSQLMGFEARAARLKSHEGSAMGLMAGHGRGRGMG